jgi:hypothetical protein
MIFFMSQLDVILVILKVWIIEDYLELSVVHISNLHVFQTES